MHAPILPPMRPSTGSAPRWALRRLLATRPVNRRAKTRARMGLAIAGFALVYVVIAI